MWKQLLTTILLVISFPVLQAQQSPTPPAGTFRLGISQSTSRETSQDIAQGLSQGISQKMSQGTESRWLKPKEKIQGVTFQWKTLPDTRGFILEVEVKSVSNVDMLYWSFGNCQPDSDVNVFSVEGQAFTCYYGESMKLRTLQAVTPTDDIRLSNGHQDKTPVMLYESGKRTDRPVLAGRCPLVAGSKLYFCFYEQNEKADYNYYLLPDIFAQIDKK